MAHYIDLVWEGNPTAQTRTERTRCGYRAYLPDPLVGRDLTVRAQLAADVADAERDVIALQGQDVGLASVESIARLLLRAEAVASSYIEGLSVSAKRLARQEYAESVGLPTNDHMARSVVGAIRAVQGAVDLAARRSVIDVDDLRDLHRELLAGTPDERWGGVVRTEQNWVGGINPCRADYVPPPHDLVPDLLLDLCDYASRDDQPAVLQAALAHAQFETIHPFVDGNGRIGRALVHLILTRRGLTPTFVPPVSLVLATRARDYIAGLVEFRHDGPAESASAADAASAWTAIFTGALQRSCADARRFATNLKELEHGWRARVGPVRANSTLDVLLSALPGLPVLTVDTAARVTGRSPGRTNDAVNRLREVGILTQGTVGRRNRVFEVTELLRAITLVEHQLATPDSSGAVPIRPVPAAPRLG